MHKNDPPPDLNLLEEMGYEPSDVDPGQAPRVTIIFFVSIIVTILISWAFMTSIDRTSTKEPAAQALERRRMPEPPNPLLQSNATAKKDMVMLRAEERKKLETYGWVDEAKGIVHIPVEQAIEEVARQGLPTRPNASVPEDYHP